jgi:hypothetical protein
LGFFAFQTDDFADMQVILSFPWPPTLLLRYICSQVTKCPLPL